MAYYYYAETCIAYLFKKGAARHTAINVIRVVLLVSTFYGTVRTASLAWGLGDIGVGLMAWLNLIAIVIMRKTAFLTLTDYEEQLAQGKDPVFDPVKLGIKNADIWTKIGKNYK